MIFFEYLKHYTVKFWVSLLLALLAAIFFINAASFNWLTQTPNFVKWSSPDETANYFFAKLYAQTNNLSFAEPLNQLTLDIIRPRSFHSDNGQVKPMSFLGLPLIFGYLGKFLGVAVLPYLTPLLAALGLVFFYLLQKAIFDKTIALIAASLASFFPIYVYYSARSMFHNVLFVDLLIIALYFGIKAAATSTFPQPRADKLTIIKHYATWLLAAMSGYFLGLAVITRSVELLWLAPVLLLLIVGSIKKLGLLRLGLLLFSVWLAVWPILGWNIKLYGGPLESGYPAMSQTMKEVATQSGAAAISGFKANFDQAMVLMQTVNQKIFYFGFHFYHSLQMFYRYVYLMFPWLFWLGLLGCLIFITHFIHVNQEKGESDKRWLYFGCWLLLSVILVLYYGSWEFHDNPNPSQFTIGNSYTRYWLPFYLGALPFVALGISYLSKLLIFKNLQKGGIVIITFTICLWSTQTLWLGSEEALLPSLYVRAGQQQEFNQVLNLTESNAVIITQYHDKLFFPERRVIVGLLTDEVMNVQYAKLVAQAPLYYYNFSLSDADVAYLNSNKLKPLNLRLKLIRPVTDQFSLYRLRNME